MKVSYIPGSPGAEWLAARRHLEAGIEAFEASIAYAEKPKQRYEMVKVLFNVEEKAFRSYQDWKHNP